MKKKELEDKTTVVITDTKTALQTIFDNLNKGQSKKLIAVPEIKELCERYEIEVNA